MKHVYTCNCLLEHLINLSYSQIVDCITSHEVFYLQDNWIMFFYDGLSFYFFCNKMLRILRKFTNETFLCLKRSDVFDDTCLDFMDFSGVNNCCRNCCISLIECFKKFLIKFEK